MIILVLKENLNQYYKLFLIVLDPLMEHLKKKKNYISES